MATARMQATYRGETLGWYDTLEEAQAAIEAAAANAKANESAELERKLFGDAGCPGKQ